ncbi:MAG: histidine phosphatase family protein, partial [Synergistaceae bacterium]|nr:histidine phosphatase family protein [Synergistaceae bacterium]
EIIYGRLPNYISAEFSECSLGVLEGKPYTNLDNDPNYMKWTSFPERAIENGESFNKFTERVCNGFEKLIYYIRMNGISSASGTMHGNVMRAVLHRFADTEISHGKWRIPNGGMYILEFDEEGRLGRWSASPDFLFKE